MHRPHKRPHVPILDPHAERIAARARETCRAATESFVRGVPIILDIGQREMGKVNLVRTPIRFARIRGGRDCAAKERELIAESSPIARFEIPSIVPPLGLKFRMRTVIVREFQLAHTLRARVSGNITVRLQSDDGCGEGRRLLGGDEGNHDKSDDGENEYGEDDTFHFSNLYVSNAIILRKNLLPEF